MAVRMEQEMQCKCLILADRHLGVLEGSQSLLRDLFDSVVMVSDEPSLIEAAAGLRPQLVILDLSLSTNQEPCIAERLLKSNPSLRVVVLSSHDEQSVAERLMAAGAAGFVVKQSIGTDLLPAVRKVIAGGTYISPSIRTALKNSCCHESNSDDTNVDTKG